MAFHQGLNCLPSLKQTSGTEIQLVILINNQVLCVLNHPNFLLHKICATRFKQSCFNRHKSMCEQGDSWAAYAQIQYLIYSHSRPLHFITDTNDPFIALYVYMAMKYNALFVIFEQIAKFKIVVCCKLQVNRKYY